MTDDELLLTLISGRVDEDDLRRAASSDAPGVLVVAAVLRAEPGLLADADHVAATARDRQLVALATAHLAADHDRFDVLVRDHLVDHPDHVVAAWLAAVHRAAHPTTRRTPC